MKFSYSTFSEWVNGAKYPRIDKVEMPANYFGIKKSDLIEEDHPEKTKTPPALTKKDERDISKQLEATLAALEKEQSGLMFDGEPLDDETRELLAASLRNRMIGENRHTRDTDYYYYVCNRAKRQHTCDKKVIRKERIEEYVIQQLNKIAFSDTFKSSLIEAVLKSYENGSLESERDRLSAEIRKTDQEIKNLVNAALKGVDCEEIQEAMAERKAHKESLQKELVAITGAPAEKMNREELTEYFDNFLNIAATPPETQRTVIQRYVERVVVYDNPDGEPVVDICLNPNQEPLSEALESCGFGLDCSNSAIISTILATGIVVIRNSLE